MHRRLSVRPSVKRVIFDKTKETCANILISHQRSFTLVCEKKSGWWGDPFYLKFWVKLTPLERKRRFPIGDNLTERLLFLHTVQGIGCL